MAWAQKFKDNLSNILRNNSSRKKERDEREETEEPWVSKILSECSANMDTAMTRMKATEPWEIGKAFPHWSQAWNWQILLPLAQVQVFMNNWPVWVKMSHCNFLLSNVYSLRVLAYRQPPPTLLLFPMLYILTCLGCNSSKCHSIKAATFHLNPAFLWLGLSFLHFPHHTYSWFLDQALQVIAKREEKVKEREGACNCFCSLHKHGTGLHNSQLESFTN